MQIARRLFMCFFASTVLFAASGAGAETLPQVMLKTDMGEVVIELYPEKAPKTVSNFLGYVKSGQYKGTIFHRVIQGFMIQTGGFDKAMKQKAVKASVENEANNGLKNEKYTVAMARTAAPHSATSQFFINVNDNASLDYPSFDGWGYCVFGKVIKGQEVVDKIAEVAVGSKAGHENVPLEPVVIQSAALAK
jgi:peptidyl-prolyl cis-trans isomerase A (cyclophilin A)/peptidyl-prolyl cis-trans isomerase B (cyclophilin B)